MSAPDFSTTAKPMGRIAGVGAMWTMGATVVAKLASLGSQLVLGWLLAKEDFGLFALAIGISTVVAAVQDGGVQRILIQQGARYEALAQAGLKMALLFKVLGAAIIALGAPFLTHMLDAPGLDVLMWIIAVNMVISAPLSIYRAKLLIDLRFSTLAKVNSTSAILRYGSMIGFAIAGLGALSFVLPLLVVTAFEWVAMRSMTGRIPQGGLTFRSAAGELLAAAKWLVLAAFCGAIIQNGDYIVIGAVLDEASLGVYFFGFQLTASFSTLISGSLLAVLMPSFTKLKDEPDRQRQALLKSLRLLALLFGPLFVAILITASPFIHVAWAGKWDQAIPVVQVLAVAFLANITAPLTAAIVEAHGRWRLRAVILVLSSTTTIAAAAAGAALAGILGVAVLVTVQRVMMGLVNAYIAARLADTRMSQVYRQMAAPLVLAIVAGAIAWLAANILSPHPSANLVLALLTFAVLYMIFAAVFMRERIGEVLNTLKRNRTAESSIPPGEGQGVSQ